MQKAGDVSSHWPREKMIEIVHAAEPDLKFDLVPTPGEPGHKMYAIMVDVGEVDARSTAVLEAGAKVRAALKGIPIGLDRQSIYAPQQEQK